MIRILSFPVLLGLVVAVTGCARVQGMVGSNAPHAEFVAGNTSQVLIDIRHENNDDLVAARQMADTKCALFGRTGGTLESLNPVSDGKDQATFACH